MACIWPDVSCLFFMQVVEIFASALGLFGVSAICTQLP